MEMKDISKNLYDTHVAGKCKEWMVADASIGYADYSPHPQDWNIHSPNYWEYWKLTALTWVQPHLQGPLYPGTNSFTGEIPQLMTGHYRA